MDLFDRGVFLSCPSSRMEIGMVPGYVGPRFIYGANWDSRYGVTTDYQRALYDLLVGAGRKYDLRPFGGRATQLHASREELRHVDAGIPSDLRPQSKPGSADLWIFKKEKVHRPCRGNGRQGKAALCGY